MDQCERCGRPFPASVKGRRFCGDTCRKQAARAGQGPLRPVNGTVTAAVQAVLSEDYAGVDRARAALAVRLAQLVDGGSVPAAGQLRGVLTDLGDMQDDDTLEFLAAVRTPGIGAADILSGRETGRGEGHALGAGPVVPPPPEEW